jgi:hypothetical protein
MLETIEDLPPGVWGVPASKITGSCAASSS